MKVKILNVVAKATGRGLKDAGKVISKHGPEMLKSGIAIGAIGIVSSFCTSLSAGESRKMRTIAETEGRRRAEEYLRNKED